MTTHIDFNLYLITDRLNLPDGQDLFAQVEAALRGGIRAVQLREKDLCADELLPFAQKMRVLTRKYDAKLLINREIDVALEVGADGVHLGGDAMAVQEARKRLGAEGLVGVSTHALNEVRQAYQGGADFVTFGPVYATPSKEKYGEPVGLDRFGEVIEAFGSRLPIFALGGVNRERTFELIEKGCRNVACIGAILFAEDAESEARSILSCFK